QLREGAYHRLFGEIQMRADLGACHGQLRVVVDDARLPHALREVLQEHGDPLGRGKIGPGGRRAFELNRCLAQQALEPLAVRAPVAARRLHATHLDAARGDGRMRMASVDPALEPQELARRTESDDALGSVGPQLAQLETAAHDDVDAVEALALQEERRAPRRVGNQNTTVVSAVQISRAYSN